jgi:hypothetical protein
MATFEKNSSYIVESKNITSTFIGTTKKHNTDSHEYKFYIDIVTELKPRRTITKEMQEYFLTIIAASVLSFDEKFNQEDLT